jgi:hypothetical protein
MSREMVPASVMSPPDKPSPATICLTVPLRKSLLVVENVKDPRPKATESVASDAVMGRVEKSRLMEVVSVLWGLAAPLAPEGTIVVDANRPLPEMF